MCTLWAKSRKGYAGATLGSNRCRHFLGGIKRHKPFGFVPFPCLLTDTELLDNRTITIDVLLGQIAQQIATVTNHLQQTTAGMMVVGMLLQMLGQLVDASGQNRDLNLRRTGIGVMQLVSGDDLIFNVLLDHFIFHLSIKFSRITDDGR